MTALTAVSGVGGALLVPGAANGSSAEPISIRAAKGRTRLVPAPYNDTAVWSYNGSVPGPVIRVRQGDRIRVLFNNQLDEESTIHWHGVRTPNSMDGVPHLTQPPVSPGNDFLYEFDAVDAGTFWYHPHQRSFEQVGRGLYGALIVEEPDAIRVDRDVTWILDDWRLTKAAKISEDFANAHDMSHNGRVGNTVTINGAVPDKFLVHPGERIRLRLINAANARIFSLVFGDHEPIVIALDGQPVTSHTPADGRVTLGPAMRVDLILDMTGGPNSQFSVNDMFYSGLEYRLIDIHYVDTSLREATPDWPIDLRSNPLNEPDIGNAIHHEILFTGGMMGHMVMRQMGVDRDRKDRGGMGSIMGMMHSGKIWFINGVAAEGHVMEPLLTLELGRSYVLTLINATAWHHPIHLHGHSFRVISRNDAPTTHREWQDTVLMAPREKIDIALFADNPGDWMFHCHILEHMVAGMMGVIRVA